MREIDMIGVVSGVVSPSVSGDRHRFVLNLSLCILRWTGSLEEMVVDFCAVYSRCPHPPS